MSFLRSLMFPAFGAGVALAGADKLQGDKSYLRMFQELGWSRTGMRGIAGTEVAAGALLLLPQTRGLGGALLAAASAAVLASELKAGTNRLALPRAAVLLVALAAAASSGKTQIVIRR